MVAFLSSYADFNQNVIDEKGDKNNCYGKCGELLSDYEGKYLKYFSRHNIEIRKVSNNLKDLEQLMGICNLVILPGGGSVPKKYYDEDFNVKEQVERDIFEKKLIDLAIKKNIPILGICRGFQFINGCFGGKISKVTDVEHITKNEHIVKFVNGRQINVNSTHNFCITKKNLSKEFDILATYKESDIVEAYYSNRLRILALQWHPERKFSQREGKKYTENLVLNFLKEGYINNL